MSAFEISISSRTLHIYSLLWANSPLYVTVPFSSFLSDSTSFYFPASNPVKSLVVNSSPGYEVSLLL